VATAAIIGTLVVWGEDGPTRLLFPVASASIFGTMALDGLRRGVVDTRVEIKRWIDPTWYWYFVVFYGVLALAMLVVGLVALVLPRAV